MWSISEMGFQHLPAHYFSRQVKPPWPLCPYLHANCMCTVKTSPWVPLFKVLHLHSGSPQLQGSSPAHVKSDTPEEQERFPSPVWDLHFYLSAQCLADTSLGWLILVWGQPKPPSLFLRNCLSSSCSDHSVLDVCNSSLKNSICFQITKVTYAWCSKLGKYRGKIITGNDCF